MLKVLHVVCDLAGGGAERMILELCRTAASDIAPEVVTVHEGGVLGEEFARAGIRVRSAGRWRGGPGGLALARLARWVRGADVVHTHLWAGDTWGRLAAVLAGHPAVISTEHNTGGEPPWKQALSRALAPISAMTVCVSEAAARTSRLPRTRVIPNGVDLARYTFRAEQAPVATRVLGIGRLTRQKGFDVLAAALPPDLHLDLVGEGEDRPRLVGPRVVLHGWQPDVRPFLATADLLAVPSRWEGFGLVAVEAMASGVPVVASAVDGLVEVVGEAGLLVPPEDPDALRAALLALAGDRDRRTALAAAGSARALRFELRRCVSAYEALYREVAAAARRV